MAPRRPSTIGSNPLDAIIPQAPPQPVQEAAPAAARAEAVPPKGRASREGNRPQAVARPSGRPQPTPSRPMQKVTLHLPADLAERAKNAVYWTPGLTLRLLATRGIHRAVEEAEKAHGGRFEQREGELTKGRLGS